MRRKRRTFSRKLKASRAEGVWLAASLIYRGDDRRRLARLR